MQKKSKKKFFKLKKNFKKSMWGVFANCIFKIKGMQNRNA